MPAGDAVVLKSALKGLFMILGGMFIVYRATGCSLEAVDKILPLNQLVNVESVSKMGSHTLTTATYHLLKMGFYALSMAAKLNSKILRV